MLSPNYKCWDTRVARVPQVMGLNVRGGGNLYWVGSFRFGTGSILTNVQSEQPAPY